MNSGPVECQVKSDFANCFFQFMGRLYEELGKKLTSDINKQAAYYGNGCGHNYFFELCHWCILIICQPAFEFTDLRGFSRRLGGLIG